MDKVTIGNSVLYCGDCFSILPRLDVQCDAIISDPPYGITACDWDVTLSFDRFWEVVDGKTKQAANFVLFGCGKFTIDLVNSKRKWYRYDLIWYKNRSIGFLQANKMPMRNHESILVFGRPGFQKSATYNPQKRPSGRKAGSKRWRNRKNSVYRPIKPSMSVHDGTLHPRSVLQYNNESTSLNQNNRLHPTQKPLALMEWLIKTYTNEGDTVIDPFMGSGTTGVAAVQAGRAFIGIEQKRMYFETACERLDRVQAEYKNQFPEVREMIEQKALFTTT